MHSTALKRKVSVRVCGQRRRPLRNVFMLSFLGWKALEAALRNARSIGQWRTFVSHLKTYLCILWRIIWSKGKYVRYWKIEFAAVENQHKLRRVRRVEQIPHAHRTIVIMKILLNHSVIHHNHGTPSIGHPRCDTYRCATTTKRIQHMFRMCGFVCAPPPNTHTHTHVTLDAINVAPRARIAYTHVKV